MTIIKRHYYLMNTYYRKIKINHHYYLMIIYYHMIIIKHTSHSYHNLLSIVHYYGTSAWDIQTLRCFDYYVGSISNFNSHSPKRVSTHTRRAMHATGPKLNICHTRQTHFLGQLALWNSSIRISGVRSQYQILGDVVTLSHSLMTSPDIHLSIL